MATKKLDKEHLEQIQQLQQDYAENANLIGNLSIEKHSLNKRLDEIEETYHEQLIKFETIRGYEQELMEQLTKRYGDGSINIADGTFTES